MSNFEDTLVNPNNSASNYQPVNSTFIRYSDNVANGQDKLNSGKSRNKYLHANIFTVGLFLALTVTFVLIVSHAF